jgi:LysB family phage lysis regulatory protein
MMAQVRLILAVLVLLAFAAMGVAVYKYKADAADAQAAASQAKAERDTAVQANKEAAATIDALQEQSRLDSRLTASLVEQMRQINDGLAAQGQQLTELEKQNADVRAYLDSLVPPDLRRLYNH